MAAPTDAIVLQDLKQPEPTEDEQAMASSLPDVEDVTEGEPSTAAADISWRAVLLLSASHFSSSWSERSFEFAAPLYLINLFPDSLFPASFYGFVTTAIAIIFSNNVGQFVDKKPRLFAVRTFILGQKFSVLGAYAVFLALFQNLASVAERGLGSGGDAGIRALFVLVCALGCLLQLSTVGINVAIQRDWVTTITTNSPASLTRLNAYLRRIDLLCKLLAPLFVSFLTLDTYQLSVIVLMTISFATMFFEFVWIQLVYNGFPVLATEQQARLSAPIEPAPPRRWNLQSINAGLHRWGMDWKEFSLSPVFPTSVSISLLYMTTLAFDSTFLTYIVWRGFSNPLIAGMRGLCVLTGLLGTILQPAMMTWVGNIRAGTWSIWSEFFALIPVFLSFFVGSSGSDDPGYAWNAALLFGGMALSRPGLWAFDLSQLQILQDKLRDHPRRNALTALQYSLQNIGDLLKYVLVMIVSSPSEFRWTALVSFVSVLAGALVWTFGFARKERGHLVHWSFMGRLRMAIRSTLLWHIGS